MKFKGKFYKLNADFSIEHAEAHHEGQASENNRRFEWEDELVLKNDISKVEVIEKTTYELRGERNGEQFQEKINDMLIFNLIGVDTSITQMACSHEIVEKYELIEDEININLKVYFREMEPLSNPIPGVYIALQKFPKSLIQ
ncbi:MAG: hypothetical protein WEA99_04605 [Brumimicrobium sp.]